MRPGQVVVEGALLRADPAAGLVEVDRLVTAPGALPEKNEQKLNNNIS